jgi:hypothetical protein
MVIKSGAKSRNLLGLKQDIVAWYQEEKWGM